MLQAAKILLPRIDNYLAKEEEKEQFEECAKLRDAKPRIERFINGELTYDEVKDDISYASSKLSDDMQNAIDKANNKKSNSDED